MPEFSYLDIVILILPHCDSEQYFFHEEGGGRGEGCFFLCVCSLAFMVPSDVHHLLGLSLISLLADS